MSISVIIPIYRVEAYIGRCVRSLMSQTMKDGLEFIFVDDCSPDKSMAMLQHAIEAYPQRKKQIHMVRHEQNRGLPAARNTGLEHATGNYIFHCDSDDYLEPDALQAMYETAVNTHADIVYTDWFLNHGHSERYMPCPTYDTAEEALRGLLHGTMKFNVWNKLVRRSLYNDNNQIRFPDGHGMGEDMTMILLFARAERVAHLPKATYHYVRQNENAFTAARSEASYADLKFNADRIIAALEGNISDEDLACFKLNVKYPFLISDQRADYARWQQWFPEANRSISSHQVSARARVLERCANHRCFLPLRLHYYLLLFFSKH